MKKLFLLPIALFVWAACGTSNTKDNDPWGNIDPGSAPKSSSIIESSVSSSVLHQTMTYSVNSYVYTAQNSADTKLADLMKATYNYGAAAEKYSR